MKKTITDLSAAIAASLETREIEAERLLQYFDQLAFLRLPDQKTEGEAEQDTVWRLVLVNLVTRQDPLALEVWNEITIGRRVGAPQVDLDLSSHNGLELGVSRVHAGLRPAPEALYLFDKGSTNGSYVNNVKATADTPLKIKDNDIISFGALKFLVKVVYYPGMKTADKKKK